ncbi:TIGR03086 family metal-binding protein [Aquihabitans sp. McL0605]|uniref:TIGR03086 family metal-binding protein n=1 Tax=Aquihabitans sp. McL0605 TaxID=3415671 RepID=UPI003CEB3B3B
MSEPADRYRRVAGQFTARVEAVPPGGWDAPAPCEGWVARDVVGHLTGWLPAFFFGTWGISAPPIPSAADDPVGAWTVLDATIQGAVDDPAIATTVHDNHMGSTSFEDTIDSICTSDVLVHTWDLAWATGLDETLDPVEVHRFVESMEPLDEVLRTSGHYGPRVPVPDGADEQTRMLAFLGRHP